MRIAQGNGDTFYSELDETYLLLPDRCPLCHIPTTDHASVITHGVYGDPNRAVIHCSVCDVKYLYPTLTDEEERRFYREEYCQFMVKRSGGSEYWQGPEQHIAASERERKRRMKHLSEFLKGKKHILEIGCGSGFMLYPLYDSGQNCVAVEPSGVFSDYIRNRGIECHESIADVQGKFDLILHYYVMEHVADPIGFLRKQTELLADGGRIVFEVPNVNDALATLYKIPAYDRFIWQVAHRWYFSVSSLHRVMSLVPGTRAPWIEIDQRYDLSNHLIWARDGRPGGMGRFSKSLGDVEEQYKQRLIEIGMGDTLIGIIRK